jgi:hypothetical protein
MTKTFPSSDLVVLERDRLELAVDDGLPLYASVWAVNGAGAKSFVGASATPTLCSSSPPTPGAVWRRGCNSIWAKWVTT